MKAHAVIWLWKSTFVKIAFANVQAACTKAVLLLFLLLLFCLLFARGFFVFSSIFSLKNIFLL